MRYTVIDGAEAISFTGPGHCLKALVAGCSSEPADADALLESVHRYDPEYIDSVRNELVSFDEHVVRDDPVTIDRWLDRRHAGQTPAFRVFNQRLRTLSLAPERLGVVLFNLPEQRIIQIQNSYAEIERKDRGRYRKNGVPQRRYYHYTLPDSWQLLP